MCTFHRQTSLCNTVKTLTFLPSILMQINCIPCKEKAYLRWLTQIWLVYYPISHAIKVCHYESGLIVCDWTQMHVGLIRFYCPQQICTDPNQWTLLSKKSMTDVTFGGQCDPNFPLNRSQSIINRERRVYLLLNSLDPYTLSLLTHTAASMNYLTRQAIVTCR